MEITIKTIRNAAITNIIILGLVGCSSSPAPWTQAEDNPWGAKREAEAQTGFSEETITDTSLNDPVLLAEPEPEPEPIMWQEPEAAPAPEVIAPVMVEELTPEQQVMAMPASNYAVQVYAGKSIGNVDNFKNNNALYGLMTVKTDRSGDIVYVLVDVHPDRATANAAAADLEIKTGSKPWVRSVAGLQKIVAQ